jgi:hypothetical protein
VYAAHETVRRRRRRRWRPGRPGRGGGGGYRSPGCVAVPPSGTSAASACCGTRAAAAGVYRCAQWARAWTRPGPRCSARQPATQTSVKQLSLVPGVGGRGKRGEVGTLPRTVDLSTVMPPCGKAASPPHGRRGTLVTYCTKPARSSCDISSCDARPSTCLVNAPCHR